MRIVIVGLIAALHAAPALAQECSVDSTGNRTCQGSSSQPTPNPSSTGNCPAGTQASTSATGNVVCQPIGGAQQPTTTTRGNCPAGSVPWVDAFGKPGCKPQ